MAGASALSDDGISENVNPALQSAVRRVAVRILPFCFFASFVSLLDRINIGYASLTMNADIGLTPATYGFGAGIFYAGYILFEVPSNFAFNRYGVRVWLARIMITWALVSAAMMFVVGEKSFYTVRFLLGVAEAGFYPGIILFLRQWFPQYFSGRALGLCLMSSPLAAVLNGPLSILIFGMDGYLGLKGWQWLFVIEALPAIAIGLIFLFVLQNGPGEARWMSDAERKALEGQLVEEDIRRKQSALGALSLQQVFLSPAVLQFGVVYFAIMGSWTMLNVWVPQIVKSMGYSVFATGFIAVIPPLCGMLGMFVWSAISDRVADRRVPLAATLLISATGIGLATLASTPEWRIAALALGAFGTQAANPVFWTLPSKVFGGREAGSSIALISSLGAVASGFSPAWVGWVREATGSFNGGLLTLAAISLCGAGIVLILPIGKASKQVANP